MKIDFEIVQWSVHCQGFGCISASTGCASNPRHHATQLRIRCCKTSSRNLVEHVSKCKGHCSSPAIKSNLQWCLLYVISNNPTTSGCFSLTSIKILRDIMQPKLHQSPPQDKNYMYLRVRLWLKRPRGSRIDLIGNLISYHCISFPPAASARRSLILESQFFFLLTVLVYGERIISLVHVVFYINSAFQIPTIHPPPTGHPLSKTASHIV